MTSLLLSDVRDSVAVFTLNNPPVNAFTPALLEEISKHVSAAQSDDGVVAIVLAGAGRTFSGGADVEQFVRSSPDELRRFGGLWHGVLDAIENSRKPVVCAIHGTAFGGGLEIAQACHYRVAASSARLGQPEVKLGIIPGAGGTQRLPRLVGVVKAIEMCATGEPIDAAEAHRIGLVDEIIAGDLVEGAVAFAHARASSGEAPPRTREQTAKLGEAAVNALIFQEARRRVGAKARGLLAPLKAVEAIEAATKLPFAEGLRREAELFYDCITSPQVAALVHVFFGEREVAKVPGIQARETRPIARAGVVGAGTMGAGIAMVYANAGIPVLLKEADPARLDEAMARLKDTYSASVKKGRLTESEAASRLGLITPTLDYGAFSDVDIAIEAVFEDMSLKEQVFRELDAACSPHAVLATNTSGLDVDRIASATRRPASVIGHHFFSPANVMRLLEVVRGRESSTEVIATSMALARRLGKIPVLAGNAPGFIGNRMLDGYGREAQFLIEEGATPAAVDAALTGFGMAMGPFAMNDLAGLDVGWRRNQEQGHLQPPGRRRPLIADRLFEMGRYGQKTAAGWYRYAAGNRTPIPDPEVEALIDRMSRHAGIPRREIGTQEIVERTIYALINEGAKILEEGIALRAVDIDIVYVYGYGFPAWRGGPMWHADEIGLDKVYQSIQRFHAEHGSIWHPAPLLRTLVEERRTFRGFDRDRTADSRRDPRATN